MFDCGDDQVLPEYTGVEVGAFRTDRMDGIERAVFDDEPARQALAVCRMALAS